MCWVVFSPAMAFTTGWNAIDGTVQIRRNLPALDGRLVVVHFGGLSATI